MSSVGIEKLKISNFRSYKKLELIFDSIPTVIYGKNGVGKTNLLEAISLLYPGKGVRRSSFQDMINFSNNFPWKVIRKINHIIKARPPYSLSGV